MIEMKKLITLIALALVIVVSSCSKEKKLEKRLADNTWNISKIEWTKTETGLFGASVTTGTETNAGTFTFTETTGTSTMTIDDETFDNASFSWTVSDGGDQIMMTYDLTIEGTNTTQRAMVIEENGKSSQKWVLTEQRVEASTGETYQLVANITLSK